MKRLVLTVHAEHVAHARGIAVAWIEAMARNPDWTEPDPTGAERRFRAVQEHGGRILRVVCTESDTELRVITVFFDRNARRPQ
jgi:hypothetical protein